MSSPTRDQGMDKGMRQFGQIVRQVRKVRMMGSAARRWRMWPAGGLMRISKRGCGCGILRRVGCWWSVREGIFAGESGGGVASGGGEQWAGGEAVGGKAVGTWCKRVCIG